MALWTVQQVLVFTLSYCADYTRWIVVVNAPLLSNATMKIWEADSVVRWAGLGEDWLRWFLMKTDFSMRLVMGDLLSVNYVASVRFPFGTFGEHLPLFRSSICPPGYIK